MSTINNSDVASTSHGGHSFPVSEQGEAQGRRESFSDGSIDPAIYKNIFDEEPLEEASYHAEPNLRGNVDQFSVTPIQNGGDYSLPDHLNSSTAVPQSNAVASQPSAGPAITITRRENSTLASRAGIVIELRDADVDDAIAILESDPSNDPNKRRKLINAVAQKGKLVGNSFFGDARAFAAVAEAAATAAVDRRTSTFDFTSGSDIMGVASGQLGGMQTAVRNDSGHHAASEGQQTIHNGGQMLRQEESNMALQVDKVTTDGFAPSQYDQTAYAGLAQTQVAMVPAPALPPAHQTLNTEAGPSQIQRDLMAVASMYPTQTQAAMVPSRALSPAHQTLKTEPETSQIQRGLMAVASMYNMEGKGNNSNSSTAGPQPNGVASQSSAGPANTATQQENSTSASGNVIELLDDDVDGTNAVSESAPSDDPNKRRKLTNEAFAEREAAAAAGAARRSYMPEWMVKREMRSQQQQKKKAVPIQRPTAMVSRPTAISSAPGIARSVSVIHEPTFFKLPDGFVPTWQQLYPMKRPQKTDYRFFELSLLNVQEFTITGLPLTEGMAPTPVTGLRSKIKEISKPHGKSVFEKDKEGVSGKWRIPLGAYRAFFSYLNSQNMTRVIPIPENQMKIASLGKARLERGFPSAGKLMSKGVPRGLATTLAPFQRGGVDFVAERNGRALIADEMGLGKTIQSIASLSMYWKEWPLLILTPSSARYHWENEFNHWLGVDSAVNNNMGNENGLDFGSEDISANEKEDLAALDAETMPLLKKSQINVLTASKDRLFPTADTKVVICSYGLAPTLVERQEITPGLFRCAIVDESHMLKNMKSQRTSRLVPILHATNRCVLLSGTPAFARPSELFPQLKILSTENDTWWGDERHFVQKYVKRTTPARRAELFAMLTGTIMIRRLKADILKSMPKKVREKVLTDVVSPEQRREFHQLMQKLREGKGVLGQLAKEHSALDTVDDHDSHAVSLSNEKSNSRQDTNRARADLVQQYQHQFQERMRSVNYGLNANHHQLDPTQQQNFIEQQQHRIRLELNSWYKEQLHKLKQEDSMAEEAEDSRKQVLNRMYTLTATAKIPLITEMIKQWLADPTKGKLCVFAHHKFVLNDLIKLTGLSNESGSSTRYIRIDGSTTPKFRQAQINTFQTDPDVRIAILGITAAGVAVTLTAASTVWFAELFWTPALMIQAEDRCHRIGQNSRVNCLYFVAKGTLDELLWKLLEKKFRDLGEFVEGKEKMKIVVDKIYHGEKEFRSIFNKPEDDDKSDGAFNFDDIDGELTGESLFDLDEDIVGEITMLGNEEMTKSLARQGDDDGPDPQPKMAGGSTTHSPQEKKAALGTSEEHAIEMLSDDDDEKPSTPASGSSQPVRSKSEEVVSSANAVGSAPPKHHLCYNQLFDGPKFEMQLALYNGRPIVSHRTTKTPSKPDIGDILVAVNGSTLPLVQHISQISQALKDLISNGSVELTFMENDGVRNLLTKNIRYTQRPAQQIASRSTPNNGPNEVIELSDDDD